MGGLCASTAAGALISHTPAPLLVRLSPPLRRDEGTVCDDEAEGWGVEAMEETRHSYKVM